MKNKKLFHLLGIKETDESSSDLADSERLRLETLRQETGESQQIIEPPPPLDEEILKALRANSSSKKQETKFHQTLVDCWKRILLDGLIKEERIELLNKYPRTGNCRLEAPVINEEINSIINEKTRKRDKYLAFDQNICGSSLSALGSAVTMVLNEEEEGIDKLKLLEVLNDAGWLLSELFHLLSLARRSFLFASMDKKMKSLLEKEKAEEWLFGAELSQKIKSARAAEKVGSTLKFQPVQKKFPSRPFSGNWKGPSAGRYQSQAGTSLRWNQRPSTRFRPQESRGPQSSSQNQFPIRSQNTQRTRNQNYR